MSKLRCLFGHEWGSYQVKPLKVRKCQRCGKMQQYVYDGLAPYWQTFKYNQTTFVYCPNCNQELIASGSFISDKELVKYKCTKCKTVSEWNFDAPAPILIKDTRRILAQKQLKQAEGAQAQGGENTSEK